MVARRSASATSAPTPTRRSTRASASSSSTWTRPASTCGRCATSPATSSSPRCSSPMSRCRAENLVGDLNDGWRITMGSLAHERGGLWVQGVAACASTRSTTCVALARRTGQRPRPGRAPHSWPRRTQRVGQPARPRLQGLLAASPRARPRPSTRYLKLAASEQGKALYELGMELCGPYGAVIDPERGEDGGRWVRSFFISFANTIAGGTSEIQRNIIAERVLGLPRGRRGVTARRDRRRGAVRHRAGRRQDRRSSCTTRRASRALADAGLTKDDVDGFVSSGTGMLAPVEVAEYLGLRPDVGRRHRRRRRARGSSWSSTRPRRSSPATPRSSCSSTARRPAPTSRRGCRTRQPRVRRARPGAVRRAVRPHADREVRDGGAPPHARVRHDDRAARRDRGVDPLQRVAQPRRVLPRPDHDRRRAELAR